MSGWIYETLSAFGYHHPLHPMLTHVPVGLTIGAFLFLSGSLMFKRPALFQTARHCILLALPAAVMALVAGWMDWQHFFKQTWIVPIRVKMVLAPVLVALLLAAWVIQRRAGSSAKSTVPVYTLCLLAVAGLGFFGGEIVYGTRSTTVEPGDTQINTGDTQINKGAAIFVKNCSLCHLTDSGALLVGPGLKGLFALEMLPISKKSVTEENIRQMLKKPVVMMPQFGNLTDKQVVSLISYLKGL